MSEQESIENIKYENLEENGKPDIPMMKAAIDRTIRHLYDEDEWLEYDERYKKAQEEETHHSWEELRRMAKEAKQ